MKLLLIVFLLSMFNLSLLAQVKLSERDSLSTPVDTDLFAMQRQAGGYDWRQMSWRLLYTNLNFDSNKKLTANSFPTSLVLNSHSLTLGGISSLTIAGFLNGALGATWILPSMLEMPNSFGAFGKVGSSGSGEVVFNYGLSQRDTLSSRRYVWSNFVDKRSGSNNLLRGTYTFDGFSTINVAGTLSLGAGGKFLLPVKLSAVTDHRFLGYSGSSGSSLVVYNYGSLTNETDTIVTRRWLRTGFGTPDLTPGVISLAHLTSATINYIDAAGGGTITNNPDDLTLTNVSGNQIGLKPGGIQRSHFSAALNTDIDNEIESAITDRATSGYALLKADVIETTELSISEDLIITGSFRGADSTKTLGRPGFGNQFQSINTDSVISPNNLSLVGQGRGVDLVGNRISTNGVVVPASQIIEEINDNTISVLTQIVYFNVTERSTISNITFPATPFGWETFLDGASLRLINASDDIVDIQDGPTIKCGSTVELSKHGIAVLWFDMINQVWVLESYRNN